MADAAADADVVEALRGVTGQFATGVTIVLSLAGDAPDEPHAATVTAFAPVSQRPPLVAVFFATDSRMHAHLLRSGRFTISLLGGDDLRVARQLARPGRASGWEGLAGVELVRRDPAPPLVERAIAWLDCALSQHVPLGDHGCFVGQVLALGRRPDAEPLLAYRGRFHHLGAPLAPAPWTVYDAADLVAHW